MPCGFRDGGTVEEDILSFEYWCTEPLGLWGLAYSAFFNYYSMKFYLGYGKPERQLAH